MTWVKNLELIYYSKLRFSRCRHLLYAAISLLFRYAILKTVNDAQGRFVIDSTESVANATTLDVVLIIDNDELCCVVWNSPFAIRCCVFRGNVDTPIGGCTCVVSLITIAKDNNCTKSVGVISFLGN